MIVECPACRTRFRVDESRIPGRGARMRCRRCGEAIIVMKEEGRRPSAPADRQNLFDLRSVLRRTEVRPAGDPEAPPPGEAPTLPPPAGEIPEADRGASEPAPGDLRSGLHGEGTAADGPLPDSGGRGEIGGPYLREPETPRDEVRDGPREEGTASAPEETPPDAAHPDAWAPDLPLPDRADRVGEDSPAAEPSFPPEASPIFSVGQETPEGRDRTLDLILDDAGSLDLLKDEYERGDFDISGNLRPQPSAEQEAQPPQPPMEEAPVEEVMSERLQAIQRELEEIGGGAPDAEEEPPPRPPEPPPPLRPAAPKPYPAIPRAGQVRAARPAIVTLLVLFLIIAAGGAYLGFTRGGKETLRRLIPGMEALWLGGESTGPRYSVGNLIGYYEGNAKAGKLFVIKGVVTNQGRKTRHGIRVHAGLLGRNGRPVAEKTVFAGNILSGETLRTSSRQAIEKEMDNRWGDSLVNLDIPPGKSVPFMVVFFDAPEGVEEYRLDARDVE